MNPDDNNGAIRVQDRKAEISINLSNIISALMLAAIIGLGTWSLSKLTDIETKLNAFATIAAVIQSDNNNRDREFREHKADPYAHHRPAVK